MCVISVSIVISVTRPPSLLIGQKQRNYAPAQFEGDITQAHTVPRPGGALDGKCFAKEIIVAFEGFDEEVVH